MSPSYCEKNRRKGGEGKEKGFQRKALLDCFPSDAFLGKVLGPKMTRLIITPRFSNYLWPISVPFSFVISNFFKLCDIF